MPRSKEFDVEAAILDGQQVFWTKGYEATSTDDLRKAMGIGRQSLYDTFGGKHGVFLEALADYTRSRLLDMRAVLLDGPTPLAGIERLLLGLVEERPEQRSRGCLGVSSMCELGTGDVDVAWLNEVAQDAALGELTRTIARGQALGEIAASVVAPAAAAQLHATLVGMRVIARGGAATALLRDIATSAVAALRRA